MYAKLRNFDLVVAKHTWRSGAVPTTVYGVPLVEEMLTMLQMRMRSLQPLKKPLTTTMHCASMTTLRKRMVNMEKKMRKLLGKHYCAKVMQLARAGRPPWTPTSF